jgi:hypothetical protein
MQDAVLVTPATCSGRENMHTSSIETALNEIRDVHAKWLAGTLASEDVLFQISDIIEAHEAAIKTGANVDLVTADQ